MSNGRCYKYVSAGVSSNAADAACSAEFANVWSIESAAKDSQIATLFPAINSATTPTGGRQNNGFAWNAGQTWGYTNWAAGQPSAQSCVRRQSSGKWEVAGCGSGSFSYICEMPAASTAGTGYFLQVNAMKDNAPVAVPSWKQMTDAQNAIGGKVIGIDVSGWGPINSTGDDFLPQSNNASVKQCDTPDPVLHPSPSSPQGLDRWTYYHLQEAARATGSVDSTNANTWTNPYVFSMNQYGEPCHAGDPSIGSHIVSAILSLTNNAREDVSVAARDVDNDSDFDYAAADPHGAAPQLTTYDLDEGTSAAHKYGYFIASVVAQPGFTNGLNGSGDPAPGGGLRCNDNAATTDIIEQCLPNTVVKFKISFGVPAGFPQNANAQIFKFDVEVRGSGTGKLGATPAVIVVPPVSVPYYNDVTFTRDYSAENVCPPGTTAVWGSWSWTADTPSDSSIDFTIASASTAAGLNAATAYPLVFTNPPGPAALVGTAIGAHATPTPNTTAGSAVVDTTLALHDVARNLNYLRVVSKLKASTDHLSAPTLNAWNLQLSCPPDD